MHKLFIVLVSLLPNIYSIKDGVLKFLSTVSRALLVFVQIAIGRQYIHKYFGAAQRSPKKDLSLNA